MSERAAPGMPARRASTDPRFSRRRRAVERSRRRRIAARAALAAAALTAMWVAFFSPLLAVDRIVVVGGRNTTDRDVAAAAALGARTNLLLMSTADVARAVRSLPWVARAEVDRMLPGTVKVRVRERRPAAVLAIGAARWTLDRRGRVLAAGVLRPGGARGTRAGAGDNRLPVLAGIDPGEVEPGATVGGPHVTGALRAYRSLPRGLRSQVVAVFAPTRERLTFSLYGGMQIRYGSTDDMTSKNEVLKRLLPRLRAEGKAAAYVDVRVPASPAVSAAPPADEKLPTLP